MKKAMFERDILYPTGKPTEPGSVHVTVYPPEYSARIPIVIESKSNHNPLDYMAEIVKILQADIFDRIRINIIANGSFYLKNKQDPIYYAVRFTDKENYSVKEVMLNL